MVRSLDRHINERRRTPESIAVENDEGVREFLERLLPAKRSDAAAYFADALQRAGERYDRYTAKKKEWLQFGDRRNRLVRIAWDAKSLTDKLSALDIISRDDLTLRIGPAAVDALVGSLLHLRKEVRNMEAEIQKNGKPRNLAAERWIMEVADIYENAFGKTASVWGSSTGPKNLRGNFYRLLELSLTTSTSFARASIPSPRQVGRVLRRRKKKPGPE
jgi:hypothetical protein